MANTKPLASQVRYGRENSTNVEDVLKKTVTVYSDDVEAQTYSASLPDGSVVIVNGLTKGSVVSGEYIPESGVSPDVVSDYAELRKYSGKNSSIYITGNRALHVQSGISGLVVKTNRVGAVDDGGTIFVLDNGDVFERHITDKIQFSWFEPDMTGFSDSSPALGKAVKVLKRLTISKQIVGSDTYFNGGPALVVNSGEYRFDSTTIVNDLAYLSFETNGKSVFFGNPSTQKTVNFLSGDVLRYLNVGEIHFQNFNKVFTASTRNLDVSAWNFTHTQAGAVNLFLDSVSYDLSRSTVVNFYGCKFQYDVKQIVRVFVDKLNFYNCWLGSGDESTSSIYANSLISLTDCVSIPGGSGTAGRCLVYLTNDNGAGGVANDPSRGVNIVGHRASNEGGQGPIVVCDFPVVNTYNSITPSITISGSNIVGYAPTAFEAGNSESGIVYLKQYPASVNFTDTGFIAIGEATAKVVAKSDALPDAAHEAFYISLDENSYRNAKRCVSGNASLSIAGTLSQYINNPDPFTFRGIKDGGEMYVVPTSTTGIKKSTFKLNIAYSNPSYSSPLLFYVYTYGQGTTGDAGPNSFAYSGTSVHLVSIAFGVYSGSLVKRISKTKLHGDTFGNTGAANADIVSVHFGTGDAGSSEEAFSATTEVTITFGKNIEIGFSKIVPAFVRY